MILSIGSSFRHLFWTIVLLLIMLYVISVYICQLISDRGHDDPSIMIEEPMLQVYFGSLPRSFLSLYQAMTGGVDWNQLLPPLEKGALSNPYISIGFSMYIAFAVLAMLNVVTGVFVESALETANADRDLELSKQVRELFKLTASDDGKICWDDFLRELNDPTMINILKAIHIDKQEARALFLLLDTNESGTIEAEEFTQGCLRLRGPATAIDLATLMYFNKRMVGWWKETMDKMDANIESIFNVLMANQSASDGHNKRLSAVVNSHQLLPMALNHHDKENNEKPVSKLRSSIKSELDQEGRNDSKRKSLTMHQMRSTDDLPLPAGLATWAGVRAEADHRSTNA